MYNVQCTLGYTFNAHVCSSCYADNNYTSSACIKKHPAGGAPMVGDFVSCTSACGFESGLGHCAHGTLGTSIHVVILVPCRQRLKMSVLDVVMLMSRPKVGRIMYASSTQPQPLKWPRVIDRSPLCLYRLSYNKVEYVFSSKKQYIRSNYINQSTDSGHLTCTRSVYHNGKRF